MENKIRVNEYVRTSEGYIGKYKKNGLVKHTCEIEDNEMSWITGKYNIVKHSKNIIDLIEVGDYVNGDEITEITQDTFVKGQINLWTDIELRDVYGDYERLKYICDDIKSIITKEQIKQIEFRIKE